MNILIKNLMIPLAAFFLFGYQADIGCSSAVAQQDRDSVAAASMNQAASQVLAPVYPYLARYIADTFDLHKKNGIGIDVGGGPGNLVTELCRHTSNMYWISSDINPWYFSHVYQKAQNNNCINRVGFIQADAINLPFRDNFADVIVSRASFHFWEDMEKGFSEIKRVLKTGGEAIVGRGLPPNMPIDTARSIRQKQDRRITGYNPNNFADKLKDIMDDLNINTYKIIIPKTDVDVQYGLWIIFSI